MNWLIDLHSLSLLFIALWCFDVSLLRCVWDSCVGRVDSNLCRFPHAFPYRLGLQMMEYSKVQDYSTFKIGSVITLDEKKKNIFVTCTKWMALNRLFNGVQK